MNEARLKGGLATLAKYGSAHYSIIGKLGGRPPQKNISQLLAERQAVSGVPKNGNKEAWPPAVSGLSLKELRRLYFERHGNGK